MTTRRTRVTSRTHSPVGHVPTTTPTKKQPLSLPQSHSAVPCTPPKRRGRPPKKQKQVQDEPSFREQYVEYESPTESAWHVPMVSPQKRQINPYSDLEDSDAEELKRIDYTANGLGSNGIIIYKGLFVEREGLLRYVDQVTKADCPLFAIGIVTWSYLTRSGLDSPAYPSNARSACQAIDVLFDTKVPEYYNATDNSYIHHPTGYETTKALKKLIETHRELCCTDSNVNHTSPLRKDGSSFRFQLPPLFGHSESAPQIGNSRLENDAISKKLWYVNDDPDSPTIPIIKSDGVTHTSITRRDTVRVEFLIQSYGHKQSSSKGLRFRLRSVMLLKKCDTNPIQEMQIKSAQVQQPAIPPPSAPFWA